MAGRIISFICYFMCAAAFWGIAKFGKDGKDPISFWSGDTSLKDKVKDVPAYNREMAKVYNIYGWAYFAAAVGGAIHPIAGVAIMTIDLIAIMFVYRAYKKILSKYS